MRSNAGMATRRRTLSVRTMAWRGLTFAGGGTVKVRSAQMNSCLFWQSFPFQYSMDLTKTACVWALLLRMRKVRSKKRPYVHPIVSKRLLMGSCINFMRISAAVEEKVLSDLESFDNC